MTPDKIQSVQLLDRFLLALCVWREARGETVKGKQLVAQVIVNRCTDALHRWPRTVPAVITQPWQFSSFNKDDANALLYPAEADSSWPDCVQAADIALSTLTGSLAPTTSANHYHVAGLDPSWRDATKVVATEGHHVFYRL